jgi:hypothetical protein
MLFEIVAHVELAARAVGIEHAHLDHGLFLHNSMMLFHFIDYADYWQAPGQQGAEFEVRLANNSNFVQAGALMS